LTGGDHSVRVSVCPVVRRSRVCGTAWRGEIAEGF
jgi:hypothetical protein